MIRHTEVCFPKCVLHLLLKISILPQCELTDKFYEDTEKDSGLLYQHGHLVVPQDNRHGEDECL